MVMRPGPDPRRGSLTAVGRNRAGSLWLWAIVLLLAGAVAYVAHTAKTANQLRSAIEAAHDALATENGRLEANLSDLRRQLELAEVNATQSKDALNQSRADIDAASDKVAELQKWVKALESQLATARSEAEAAAAARAMDVARLEGTSKSSAARNAELAQEIENLGGKLSDATQKLSAANAEIERLKAEVQTLKSAPAPAPAPATPDPSSP